MTNTHDKLREAVARAIWKAGGNASTTKWASASYDAKLIAFQKADAIRARIEEQKL